MMIMDFEMYSTRLTTTKVQSYSFDEDTRTHKVFRALDEICDAWNLAKPIWLDTNISEFKRRSKTRFTQDNFIESLEFDYLEIQITEE